MNLPSPSVDGIVGTAERTSSAILPKALVNLERFAASAVSTLRVASDRASFEVYLVGRCCPNHVVDLVRHYQDRCYQLR
jgi:hypothetical protein